MTADGAGRPCAQATSSPSREVARVAHHEEPVMGTVVAIDVYARGGETDLDDLVAGACAVLHRADDVFSTWNQESTISRLRRGDVALGDAPAEVLDVLRDCAVARRLSWGWFDPWAMPGGVDPTGYVKGWAAQQALQAIRRPGIHGAVVNAAGDIAAFGSPRPNEPFRIGVVDPFDPQRLACLVEPPGAIATSGTYERGSHLIDPRTRAPAARLASASVCGPDLGLADALATALAVAGTSLLAAVEAVDRYEALAIGLDGRIHRTSHFPFARVAVDPVGDLPVAGRADGAGPGG